MIFSPPSKSHDGESAMLVPVMALLKGNDMDKNCKTCRHEKVKYNIMPCDECDEDHDEWEPKETKQETKQVTKECSNCKYEHEDDCDECYRHNNIPSEWEPKETEQVNKTNLKGSSMKQNYQAKVFVRDEKGEIIACLSGTGTFCENPDHVPTMDVIADDLVDARSVIDLTNSTAITSLKEKGKVVYDIAPFPAS